MSINLFMGMGNIGQEIDLRYMPDGKAVANFSIACGERWKDKVSGEIKENTEWIRCVVFGRRAEVINEHFKKGSQIHVTGKMRTRMWEKDGAKHYATEIVVSEFQFCGQRSDAGGARASQQSSAYGQDTSQAQGNDQQGYQSPQDETDFDDCPY